MIKIWDGDHVDQDVYLYLKHNQGPEGVTVCARDRVGNHLYSILTIHAGGVHFHNLKNLINTPFPLTQTEFDGDKQSKRINISRM